MASLHGDVQSVILSYLFDLNECTIPEIVRHFHGSLALVRLYCSSSVVTKHFFLNASCSLGHLETCKLFSRHAPSPSIFYLDRAFYEAAKHGHLHVLKWLKELYQLSVFDTCSEPCNAFVSACENGHLHVARWLAKEFAFTKEDFLDNHACAINYACAGGHMHVLRWLIHRFSVTKEDIVLFGDNYALINSCKGGHVHMAQWIVETFQLTAKDVRASADKIIKMAFERGHLTVVQWLTSFFDLEDIDKSHVHSALLSACRRGHFLVLEWSLKEFGLWLEKR